MWIPAPFRRAALARLAVLALGLGATAACDEDFVDRGVLADPEASVIVVSGSNQAGPLGSPLRNALRVQVRDSRGRPLPGQRVDFRQTVGDGALSADFGFTDHAGMTQVLFMPLSEGNAVVEAQPAGSAARTTFLLEGFDATREVKPGSLEKVAGDNQRGGVGTVLPQPLTVRVENLNGGPLADYPVVFTATTDGTLLLSANRGDLTQIDSLGNPTSPGPIPAGPDSIGRQIVSFTDGNGIANVLVRLRVRPGSNQVSAALTSATGTVDAVVFTATGEAGSASSADSLVKVSGDEQNVTQDTTGIGGTTAIEFNPMVVQVTDRFGNPIPGVQVVFRISVGFGTLSAGGVPCPGDVCFVTSDAGGFASVVFTSDAGSLGEVAISATAPGVGSAIFEGSIAGEGGSDDDDGGGDGGGGDGDGDGGGGGGDNPAPIASILSPNSATAGGAGFPMTILGSGFTEQSLVVFDGNIKATTFVSESQLQTFIDAADIDTAGTVQVTVFNPAPGGGTAPPLTFTINP